MARQTGIIKLRGTIGGMTFYKTSADGHMVREKGGIEASRIARTIVLAAIGAIVSFAATLALKVLTKMRKK